MTSREGFDAYCLYLAINNHFNTESYDYFKYNGKVPTKIQAFLKRNDKYHFAKLARTHREELKDFLVANLSTKKYYVKNLLENECVDNYKEFKKRKQKLSYCVIQDMRYLKDKYDSIDFILECENGQHPPILKEYLGRKISPETIIAFDIMFGVFLEFEELIQEKFIWPVQQKKLSKLKPFIEFDRLKLRNIMREVWIQ